MSTHRRSHHNPEKHSATKHRKLAVLLAITGAALPLLFTACVSVNPEPTSSPTPEPPTPTATVFFPTLIPTNTPTPMPSPTPTPERLPSLGETLYEDRFDQDQGWQINPSSIGGASFVNGRLVLALQQSQSFYAALSPQEPPANFYAEITTRAEICSDNSDFGLVFRVSNFQERYRFALNCSGEAQVLLSYGGSEIVLVPLTQTNVALPGILAQNRLGVYANGSEFTFYINGSEVFTARNAALSNGAIGVYLRSREGEQTTVSFDDFRFWSVQPITTPAAP